MARKSESEIALIRESGRWCAHAHRLLQGYTRPGKTEAEASLQASHETTLAMLEALGESYGGGLSSSSGASAGYRGQIGLRSSWAHAIAHNRVSGRRRTCHGDERADLGLQRRARAGDDHRPADGRSTSTLRPHRRRAAGRLRRGPAGRHLRRRGRRSHALLRAERPAPLLAPHTGHAIGLRTKPLNR